MAGAAPVPAHELAELRRTEREVMASILGSDFQVLQPKAWHGAAAAQVETYEIVLRPEDESQKAHVAVVLHIALTRTYPNTHPTVHVRANDARTRGVPPSSLEELGEVLQEKARSLIGAEMIWELVSVAQEFISVHNAAPAQDSSTAKLSLEERMRKRAETEQQDEARRVQEEHAQRAKAEQQRSRELATLIENETRRQKAAIREERRKLRDTPMAPPPPATSEAGASVEMEKADQEAFALASVPLPASPVRRGPLLETFPLARSFVAFPEQLADANETLWALDITPITAPYYASAAGSRKLDDLEADLHTLQKIRAPSLAPLLGFVRAPLRTPELPQASALCIVRSGAGAWRMSQLLAQCRTLPWPSVRSHLQCLLDALHALHSAQLVHRQVALEHILLEHEQVRLSGAVYRRRLWDMHRSNPLNAMRTEETPAPDLWRSPEAISDPINYHAPRDLWDLGRCACQMLFGTHVMNTYASPEQLWDSMQGEEVREAKAFLQRLMHRSPQARGTAAELRTLLDETSASQWHSEAEPASPARTVAARAMHQSMRRQRPPRHAPQPEPIGSFWQLRNVATPSYQPVSRYLSDFEEVEFLGKGAFGVVVKAKNKLDGRFYAVKKVRLSSSAAEEERTMREIMTLSRLDHPHIVRYVTCWIEETQVPSLSAIGPETSSEMAMTTSQQMDASAIRALNRFAPHAVGGGGGGANLDDFLSTDKQDISDLDSYIEFGSVHDDSNVASEGNENRSSALWASHSESNVSESSSSSGASLVSPTPPVPMSSSQDRSAGATRVLYIQMEYVENQTLSDAIERGLSVDEAWNIFRQMLEALVHIASVGIIHRDLKPSNVLMYGNGDIKIGDFGLATTNLQTIETGMRESVSSEQSGDDKELTSGLGTFSYIAPEVLAKQGLSTRYNFKVDMFSLGVMFFEMLASQRYYKTTMERNQLIRDLRQPSVELPSSWDEEQFPAQTQIIRQLLSHDPSQRPSPMAMLHSPLLPPKMQDEYVEELLRLAASPSSVHRHQLIASLFSKTTIDEIRDFTFDTGAQSDEDDVLVGVVCQYLRSVFQKRGAVPVHPPLLFPPNDALIAETNVVKLLDKTGNVVLLPFDLTVPFARICARSGHQRIKRFDIADVYRENLLAGGQPRAVLAASYDIVSPDPDYASEAEMLDVLDEILDIPGLAGEPWEMELGHETIVDVLLRRFPERIRPAIVSALPLLLVRHTEQRTKQQLAQLGLTEMQLDDLDALHLRGDVQSTTEKLLTLLTPSERAALAAPIAAMQRIALLAHQFGVRHKLLFMPLITHGLQRYQHGTIFAVVKHVNTKHREVLAVGGRYDQLLTRFAFPSTSATTVTTPRAAGVQIAVGKIVAALAKYQQVHVPRLMGRPEEERTLGPWTPRRCGTLCY